MGEEWEMAILAKTERGKPTPQVTHRHIELLFECLPHYLYPKALPKSGRRYLPNGALLYVDTGGHVEYATAEGKYPESIVICSKAGEITIREAAEAVNKHPDLQKGGVALAVFKNNAAQNGLSYGVHENYLTRRNGFTVPDRKLLWRIGWFLGTRMIFTGNGWIGITDKGSLFFSLSQRIRFIHHGVSSGTTSERAIINTRDDMMVDSTRFRRLHIISGDTTIFQAATYLKFGTADLVLDMIEEGYLREFPFGEFSDGQILEGLHVYARDPSLRVTYRGLNAIDRQEWYYERACRYYKECGNLTESRKRMLEMWRAAIQAARSERPEEVLTSIAGWAAKYMFLEKNRERLKYTYEDPLKKIAVPIRRGGEKTVEDIRTVLAHVKSIDYDFDRISPMGLGLFMEERGLTERIVPEEKVLRARMGPIPGETRAYPRGKELAWAYQQILKGAVIEVNADWDYVRITFADKSSVRISHANPFDTSLNHYRNLNS